MSGSFSRSVRGFSPRVVERDRHHVVVDVLPVRGADEDDLRGAGAATARTVVAVGDARAQVVAHRRSHWQVGVDVDAVLRQVVLGPDPRAEQHRRSPECTGGHHDFVGFDLLTVLQDHAPHASALDVEGRGGGARAKREVAALAHLVGEVGEARRDATRLVVDRDREGAHAGELARVVDVVGLRLAGFDHAVVEGRLAPAQLVAAPAADRERTVAPMDGRCAEVCVALGGDERALDVAPAPAVHAGGGPGVVVRGLAAQCGQSVHGGGAAQQSALDHRDRARLPRHRSRNDEVAHARPAPARPRRIEDGFVVGAVVGACFEQRHAPPGVLGEPRAQHRARGAAAHDHDVSAVPGAHDPAASRAGSNTNPS